jgi:hypothetical protein
MIHPQPTSMLLLMAESERVGRHDETEPVIAAPRRSWSALLLARGVRALLARRPRRGASRPRPVAAVESSPPACGGARVHRQMIDPIGAAAMPSRGERGRSRHYSR